MTDFRKKMSHLKEIQRVRIPEDRDLNNGLRLNRNEKVDIWPEGFLKNIFSQKPDNFLSIYPDFSNLYQKISEHIDVDESKILVTSGIDGAMKTLWEIVTQPGDRIGVPGPTYAMYYVYNRIFKTELSEIPYLKSRKLDFKKLNDFLDLKPSIFFLPNPNQPIEDTLLIEKINDLTKKAKLNNTLFVVDEAYYYFGADSAMPLVDEHDNLIVMRTFSKGFGAPSIRLGYMVSCEENMEFFSKTRFAHETSALSATVAEYLLDNFHFVEEYNNKIIQARIEIKLRLEELGINSYGEKGNYLLIDFKRPDKCLKIVNKLKEDLIYVKSNYPEPWGSCILITLGPIELMERFLSVISKNINN
jgi:histidinol-phosphate aminotransferase